MDYDYSGLPEHIRSGVRLYIEDRIRPGGFLTAVIQNNLKESFARADDINLPRMFDIVKWFYLEAPGNCWGSPQIMKDWIGD